MLGRIVKILQWPALVVGTVAAIYVALHVANRGGGNVLEFEVDLKPGVITSTEFRVGMKAHYDITLEAERNLPVDEINGLLGIQRTVSNWSLEPVVDIEWTLKSGNSVVASGSSRDEKGGGWGRGVFRTLGRFDGLPKTPYVLEINILRDGSALAPARPRIIVNLDSEDVLDLIIIPRAKSTFISVIAVIVVALFLAFVLVFRQRDTGKNPEDDSPRAVH